MVEFRDGSIIAQLGPPDMRVPIAHCLAWPERLRDAATRLDWSKVANLSFEMPDLARFPALALARAALEAGGAAPTVLNAANEIAVAEFLAGRLGFAAIPALVEATLEAAARSGLSKEPASVEDALSVDHVSRSLASGLLPEIAHKGFLTTRSRVGGPVSMSFDFLGNFSLWGGGFTGSLLPFLFVLTVVVFFHELGHFLVARWCGVRVLVFSVGFGPELFGFNDVTARAGKSRQFRSAAM